MLLSLSARPTVVLADDHPSMLAEVARFLDPYCEILAKVENGALAVQAISAHRPAIAILDIAMPGMTGIEAARRLRETNSPTRIIFLTIQADPEYLQVARDLGAGFVIKSRMRSDLLPAMENVLGRQVAS